MKTWKLDADGDLDLTGGSITTLEGADYVRQKIQTRLRFLKGEWFLDTRLGFPYFEEVLGQRVRPERLNALYRQALTSIPDVESVDAISIAFDAATREVSVEYTVRTTDGEIVRGGVPFIIP